MARIEHKYLIPVKWLEQIRNDTAPYLTHDYYSAKMANKEYTVRSIYLDTPDLSTYHEKLAGLLIRAKYRVRGYNENTGTSSVFLEIKRKNNEYVSKDRAPVLYSELNKLLASRDMAMIQNHSYDYEKRLGSARNFFYYYLKNNLKPVILVTYEREALECRLGSGLRVTFDLNVRNRLTNSFDTLFDDSDMKMIFPENFVFEIKYARALPSWLPNLINKYGLKREAISKYALSVDQQKINGKLIANLF